MAKTPSGGNVDLSLDASWSPSGKPTTSDDVVIDSTHYGWVPASFTLNAASITINSGTLTLSGGSVLVGATGTGTITVNNGGTLAITANVPSFGAAVACSGAITHSGGTITCDKAVTARWIWNSGGSYTSTGDAGFSYTAGTHSWRFNGGSSASFGGSGSSNAAISLAYDGVDMNPVTISNGNFTNVNGMTIAGSAAMTTTRTGGTFYGINLGSTFIDQAGSALTWTSALSVGGTGTYRVTNPNGVNFGTANIYGTVDIQAGTATLAGGTLQSGGSFLVSNGAILNCGAITLQSNNTFLCNHASSQINFNSLAGGTNGTIEARAGTITISGTLSTGTSTTYKASGGTFNIGGIASGSSYAFFTVTSGTMEFQAASHTAAGYYTCSGGTMKFRGSSIGVGANGTVTASGTGTVWLSYSAGLTTISSGTWATTATVRIDSTSAPKLTAGSFSWNAGTLTLASGVTTFDLSGGSLYTTGKNIGTGDDLTFPTTLTTGTLGVTGGTMTVPNARNLAGVTLQFGSGGTLAFAGTVPAIGTVKTTGGTITIGIDPVNGISNINAAGGSITVSVPLTSATYSYLTTSNNGTITTKSIAHFGLGICSSGAIAIGTANERVSGVWNGTATLSGGTVLTIYADALSGITCYSGANLGGVCTVNLYGYYYVFTNAFLYLNTCTNVTINLYGSFELAYNAPSLVSAAGVAATGVTVHWYRDAGADLDATCDAGYEMSFASVLDFRYTGGNCAVVIHDPIALAFEYGNLGFFSGNVNASCVFNGDITVSAGWPNGPLVIAQSGVDVLQGFA